MSWTTLLEVLSLPPVWIGALALIADAVGFMFDITRRK